MEIKIGTINHSENEGERVTILWDSESHKIISGTGEDTELTAETAEQARDIVALAWGAKEWGLKLRSASAILGNLRGRPQRFRFDRATGSVYEFSASHRAYLFCGKLLGRSQKKFIADYERDLREREMLGEE